MSLMKSLARVAAGVMLAKGIGAMMQNQRQSTASAGGAPQGGLGQGGTAASVNRGSGGLLDELLVNRTAGAQGSLRDRLGQVLGGQTPGNPGTGRPYGGAHSTGAQGGLGGLLDSLTQKAKAGGSGAGGSLSDILGQLAGGAKSPRSSAGTGAGGLGDLLGALLGGAAAAGAAGGASAGTSSTGGLAQKGSQATNDASFGELLNDAVSNNADPAVAPTPEQNAVAGLMLKAMFQAAKADGKVDETERQRLLGHLGEDLDDEERNFVREQMAAPMDVAGLAREVPKGLEAQVYLMSLMAIDFDNEAEARYLNDLAQAMGLSREAVNAVHKDVGATPLYS
jgi:uncharacterized membrane protein YebE (DUF533 family)